LDENEVISFLKARRGLLDGVVVSGGEPCLAHDLDDFIKTIKGLGYQVKLDTNGSEPETVAKLLERHLVDYVALDLKADPFNYPIALGPKEATARVRETIGVLKRQGKPHEYRTTVVSPFVTEESIVAIAEAAQGQWPLYLQPFRKGRVLNEEFMKDFPDQPGGKEIRLFRNLAGAYLPTIIRGDV
jgi:pyruvate formate lyase activating enzyme